MDRGRETGPENRRIHRIRPKDDVEREFAFHVEMRERELIEQGWDPPAARAEAERLFGSRAALRSEALAHVERHARSTRRNRMWNDLRQDVGYAVRWLIREPVFTTVAILTLALGIGANSAAFSIVRSVLLAPLPYPDADRLVALREVNENGNEVAVAWPNFAELRERSRSVEGMTAFNSPNPVTVLGGAEPVLAMVATVTGNFFDVLGVVPARGRVYAAEELVPGGVQSVIVSDRFWRTQLGSRELGGVSLQLLGASVSVIGVMPVHRVRQV
jgi:hypothetical protein